MKSFSFSWLHQSLLFFSVLKESCAFHSDRQPTSVVLMWNMCFAALFHIICVHSSSSLHYFLHIIASILFKCFFSIIKMCFQRPAIFFHLFFQSCIHILSQRLMIMLKRSYGVWWKNVVTSIRKVCYSCCIRLNLQSLCISASPFSYQSFYLVMKSPLSRFSGW